MQLDIHTLSAITTALLLGIATVLGTLALSNSRHRSVVGSFAVGYAMLAGGFLGLSLRNLVPEAFSIVLANCLLGGAIVLFWRGSRYMVGKTPRRRIEMGLIGSLERRTVSLNRRGFLRRWVCDSLPGGGDLRCQKPIRLICASG
ncbi:MAG: hypothetical protein ACREEL_13730, partial [Stellaceae bacterium]